QVLMYYHPLFHLVPGYFPALPRQQNVALPPDVRIFPPMVAPRPYQFQSTEGCHLHDYVLKLE
ncbi:12524_t:CDS:1, partial [Acaulospora colombiana]